MQKLPKLDGWICFVILFLSAVSILEVGSAITTRDWMSSISEHTLYLLLGLIIGYTVSILPYQLYVLGAFLGLFTAALWCALGDPVEANGAIRAYRLFGFSLQPQEVLKASYVVTVSFMLAMKADTKAGGIRDFIILLAVAILLFVFFNSNSTAALLVLWTLMMMWIAKYKFVTLIKIWWKTRRWLIYTILISIVGAVIYISLSNAGRTDTGSSRLRNFFADDPPAAEYVIDDINRQPTYAHIIISQTDLVGSMPGNGMARSLVPQAISDYIYVVILDELGLIGGAIVLFLYLSLMWRARRVKRLADEQQANQAGYIYVGCALIIVMQALLNMSVAVGIAPVTGQNLPMVSHGGTSLVITSVLFGLMLGINSQLSKSNQPIQEVKSDVE